MRHVQVEQDQVRAEVDVQLARFARVVVVVSIRVNPARSSTRRSTSTFVGSSSMMRMRALVNTRRTLARVHQEAVPGRR